MPSHDERVERRLAAILAADVAGYSRPMSTDEIATLRARAAHRDIMNRLISEHGGRISYIAGDSVLAEFPSAVSMRCSVRSASKSQTLRRPAALPETFSR